MALAWHTTGALSWERDIIIHARRHPPPGVNHWPHLFQPAPFIVMTATLAIAALVDRRPRLAFAGAFGCLFAAFAAEDFLKPLVDSRQRPARFYPADPVLHIGALTFPSAHVTAATAIAAFAWLLLRRYSGLAAFVFALPVVVAWAMVSLDLHYPRDVVGGFVLGSLVVFGSVAFATSVFGPDRARTRATDGRRAEPDPVGSS
ncbi:MAG TPA: phosphatase PAP2 family protein [Candidatus Elarobacter sp.]|nr:phosphatase PAP2 family protein [Candidatus Elarobacter sp.]